MTLTIYGDGKSGNCLKVKWTAEKLAIPYRWLELDVLRAQTRTPDFLALNPAGQVPLVILPDGRALAQSNAIIVHLAEGSQLIPKDSYDRAKMFEWLFWEQYSHEPVIAVRRAKVHLLGQTDAEIDPSLLPRGQVILTRMDEHLRGQDWLVGTAFTLADMALLPYTRFADQGGFELHLYPAIQAWIRRCEVFLGLPAL